MIKKGLTIIVTANEVRNFNNRWPCSVLKPQKHWFDFDGYGNLVDTSVDEKQDGGASVAMAGDCRIFLMEGKRPEWSDQP